MMKNFRERFWGFGATLVFSILSASAQQADSIGTEIKAVSVLSGKAISETAFSNPMNALAGQIKGMFVITGGGEPGAEQCNSFLIRGKRTTNNGNNSPYILVDGIERDLTYLDPNEIESISVLKDAAATAIYGIKGSSGVILVKTKRGKAGRTNITFDTQLTLKSAMNLPVPANAINYMTYYNEARINDGNAPNFYAQDRIDAYKANSDPYLYPDVNWLDNFFNQSSFKQRYSLSIDGGTEKARYQVILSYLADGGNFATQSVNTYSTQNKQNKYSIRSNVDLAITSELSLAANIWAMFNSVIYPSNNSGTDMYGKLVNYSPVAHPILNRDGSIAGSSTYKSSPYKTINYGGYAERLNRQITTDLKLQYDMRKLVKGLKVYGTFAFDNINANRVIQAKDVAVYELVQKPDETEEYTKWGVDTKLSITKNTETYYRRMTVEAGVTYNRIFGKHQVGALLMGYNNDFQNDTKLPHDILGAGIQINYGYDNRYLLDFSAGWNGTEQFPAEKRMFFYPAVAAGWVVTNEVFMKKQSWVNYLKIRGSWGITGNELLKDNNGTNIYYDYLSSLQKGGGGVFFGEGNPTSITGSGTFRTGYIEGNIANPSLRPEETTKVNLGLDMRFLKNQLYVSVDLFKEYTRYIYSISQSTPGMVGIPNGKLMMQNTGEVSNKGVEFELGYSGRRGDFEYLISANGMHTTNKIEFLEEPNGLATPQTNYALGAYWGYKNIGFFQTQKEVTSSPSQEQLGRTTPGDLKFADRDNNQIIDIYDQFYLGSLDPNFYYGFTLGTKYKRWELSALFQGSHGGKKICNTGINIPFTGGTNLFDFQLNNHWTESNSENARYPRLTIDGSSSTKTGSDFWLKDASYLRLKNLELAYTLPISKFGKNTSLRLYVSGTNLICWDKLDGVLDPDMPASGMSYPANRMFTFGLRLKL